MLSAIEIPGFLNQLCLKKKKKDESAWFLVWWYRFKKQMMLCTFLVGCAQNTTQPIKFQDS